MSLTVDVVIPALNEEAALSAVLSEIPDWVRRVVVADNGSTDATARIATEAGAQVVCEPRRGYGAACLKALEWLAEDPPDVVAFLDGDHSDYPAQLADLIDPLERGVADLVVGSRVLGRSEHGALSPQQRVGNAVACTALQVLYGAKYTDLGPFRAVRWPALLTLGMRDRDYGWTVEMQIKAARKGLAHREVPVDYRKRIGVSKVSGTLRGSFGAAYKILWLLARYTAA